MGSCISSSKKQKARRQGSTEVQQNSIVSDLAKLTQIPKSQISPCQMEPKDSITQDNETKKTANDFKFLKLLGEGSFSSVYLAIDAREKPNSNSNVKKYAIKVCEKALIKRNSKPAAIMREKQIMKLLNDHPNKHFTKLCCTFQDTTRLFFVMSYADNGELLEYMQNNKLSMHQVKRYTIELIDALEHIHRLGIVHRDMKPENILLDKNMSILITDFGSASLYLHDETCSSPYKTSSTAHQDSAVSNKQRKNSFVGTAQYVSPEMLNHKQSSVMSDIWAYGVIVFQMIANTMPFDAPNEYLIYQKILALDYKFTSDFDELSKDFIENILRLEPSERLGYQDNLQQSGYISIRHHSFINHFELDESDSKETLQDLSKLDDVPPGLDEKCLLNLLIK